MAKIDEKERKSIIDDTLVEVNRNTDANMAKSRVSQCKNDSHIWRKLTDTEVACTKCPTVKILEASAVESLFPTNIATADTVVFEKNAILPDAIIELSQKEAIIDVIVPAEPAVLEEPII
jgi:hypothetical protein